MSKYKNCRNVQSKSPAGYFERAISQHSLLDSLPAVELSICLAYAHLCVLYSRMCMLVAERISTAHLTQSVRAKLAYHTHTTYTTAFEALDTSNKEIKEPKSKYRRAKQKQKKIIGSFALRHRRIHYVYVIQTRSKIRKKKSVVRAKGSKENKSELYFFLYNLLSDIVFLCRYI